MRKLVLLFLIAFCIVGCSSFNKEKSIQIAKYIVEGDYEKVMEESDDLVFQQMSRYTFTIGLQSMHDLIQTGLGSEVEYTFIQSEKKYRIQKGKEPNIEDNHDVTIIMLSNGNKSTMLTLFYNRETGKPYYFHVDDVRECDMTRFWILSSLGLLVIAFIIYTIVRVKKSDMKKKWVKYILAVVVNIPLFLVTPVGVKPFLFLVTSSGVKLSLGLSIMGVGFEYLGPDSYTKIAFPLGSIIVLYLLRKHNKKKETETVEATENSQNEIEEIQAQ